MKTFNLISVFIVFLLMMNNENAWAQPDSFNHETLVLKNKNTNKEFIICKGERVAVKTVGDCHKRGELIGISDSFVIIIDTVISIVNIDRIKYIDGTLKDMKKYGIVLLPLSSVLGVTGLFLLRYESDNEDMTLFDLLLFYASVGMIAPSPYTELLALAALAFPYKSFNLKTKWQIVPFVH